jgi:hypothetical protein
MATKHKKKKITKSDIIGEQGIALIHQRVSGMGFLWHPTGVEVGIDGFAEIRDDSTDEVTGHFVCLQSKATHAARFTAETDSSFEYLCEESDLDYWLNCNAPIVLIVSRPNKDEAYWACINDRFKDLASRKSRRIYFNKTRDKFDANARDAIAKLAIPKDSGFYLAPPPKQERLFSNLLGLSRFAERTFVAQTDIRYTQQLWDSLRDLSPQVSGPCVLTDKTLVSFHDLREEPWRQVCDRGSVESFDSDEFAYAPDEDKGSIFLRLIYGALKDMLWKMGVRFDKELRHYHFMATKDLKPRKIYYQSLEKNTSRVVFGPYFHKKETTKLRYYRHHAFDGQFRRFDDGWYLQITPTYRFTSDGKLIYRWYEDELSGIKRLENNQAVLGQVVMWANLLSKREGMFSGGDFIEFGELKAFDIEAGVFDKEWSSREESEPANEDQPVLDDPQLSLFNE